MAHKGKMTENKELLLEDIRPKISDKQYNEFINILKDMGLLKIKNLFFFMTTESYNTGVEDTNKKLQADIKAFEKKIDSITQISPNNRELLYGWIKEIFGKYMKDDEDGKK